MTKWQSHIFKDQAGFKMWERNNPQIWKEFWNEHQISPCFCFCFFFSLPWLWEVYSPNSAVCPLTFSHLIFALPGGSGVKNLPANGFNPWVRKISSGKKWQPTPVFLRKSPGQRSLAGYSLWRCKRIGRDLTNEQQQHLILTVSLLPERKLLFQSQ